MLPPSGYHQAHAKVFSNAYSTRLTFRQQTSVVLYLHLMDGLLVNIKNKYRAWISRDAGERGLCPSVH